jgi:acyl dehydratase
MQRPIKYHWEDFAVGTVRETGTVTVSREEILAFGRAFDPQPFHVDEAAAAASPFGALVASGWHTCGLAMRLLCDAYLLETATAGSPGVESLKWLRPVRPGDTLRVRTTVLEARPLASKPHLGLIRNRWQVLNQDGDEVMHLEGFAMLLRRPASPSAAGAPSGGGGPGAR